MFDFLVLKEIFYPVLMNGLNIPHVKSEFKKALDSGFQAVDSGFQILNFFLCQWNLDSGF